MDFFSSESLDSLDKIYRINLVNSITGYKSANLIGTQSLNGIMNLAIFSSVIHLGSNPALIGFVLRPTTVPRHTYSNLKATGNFTLNAVTKDYIKDAHQTSAKYPEEISEFDITGLVPEYHNKCIAPFVKGSPVQMEMKFIEEYHIKSNNVIHIIAEIKNLYVKDEIIQDDGFLNLSKAKVAAINGLDAYAIAKNNTRFEYQRPKNINSMK